MGTTTISKDNAQDRFMTFKAQGVNKVYILFDGDDAGRKASQSLKPILEDIGLTVEILELPDDTDPGELSASEIKSLNTYVNNEEVHSDN
jgi:DNA primase